MNDMACVPLGIIHADFIRDHLSFAAKMIFFYKESFKHENILRLINENKTPEA